MYNNRGLIESICESNAGDAAMLCPANASTYVRTLETDAWGHATRQRLGNSAAMEVTTQYWSNNGRIASICAGNATTCNLMKELYAWDAAGNLSTLQKENRTLETMNYDRLNRLTDVTLAMQGGVTVNKVAQAWVYDALGNICRKTEWGATLGYDYLGRAGCGVGGLPGTGTSGTAGPHQVATIGATYLAYDARGNQTNSTRVDTPGTNRDRFIRYSLDDKGYEIALGNPANPMQRTRFWYGSDGQRYKREDGSVRTLYLGNVEIVIDGAVTTFKRSIGGVMLQTITGATSTNYYLFRDQLGSLVRVTNASGVAVSSQDYNAFGVRRAYTNPNTYQDVSPRQTNRGFTGQEQVDGSFVVHMNGRLYGSEIGRFLQADPVIQAPGNTQSWNAYTYVFNNPYAYTDPTGMIGQSERQWAAVIVAVVAAYFGQYYLSKSMLTAAFAVTVAGGFVAGAIATQSLRGGLLGAFGAAITFGIGAAANYYEWGNLARASAQAMAGGVMGSLQGGEFGSSFVAAGVTAALMPGISRIDNNIGRTFVGALLGGTMSEVTGGKFANGAISGAIMGAMAGSRDTIAQEGSNSEGSATPSADEGVSPSSALSRRMVVSEGEGSREMSISLTISAEGLDAATAQAYVDTAKAGWNTSIVGDDGITRTFGLDLQLVRHDGNLRMLPCEPSVCTSGLGAANVGGPKIWYSPKGRPDTPVHEMGHVLGFSSNRASGTGSIMSPDSVRGIMQRDFDRLWGAYRAR